MFFYFYSWNEQNKAFSLILVVLKNIHERYGMVWDIRHAPCFCLQFWSYVTTWNVFISTGEFGVPKSRLFFLRKSYWCGDQMVEDSVTLLDSGIELEYNQSGTETYLQCAGFNIINELSCLGNWTSRFQHFVFRHKVLLYWFINILEKHLKYILVRLNQFFPRTSVIPTCNTVWRLACKILVLIIWLVFKFFESLFLYF